jgi:hypothetical protein
LCQVHTHFTVIQGKDSMYAVTDSGTVYSWHGHLGNTPLWVKRGDAWRSYFNKDRQLSADDSLTQTQIENAMNTAKRERDECKADTISNYPRLFGA